MKNLIAVVLLLGCGIAQAAIVTIDFDEFDGVQTIDHLPVGSIII